MYQHREHYRRRPADLAGDFSVTGVVPPRRPRCTRHLDHPRKVQPYPRGIHGDVGGFGVGPVGTREFRVLVPLRTGGPTSMSVGSTSTSGPGERGVSSVLGVGGLTLTSAGSVPTPGLGGAREPPDSSGGEDGNVRTLTDEDEGPKRQSWTRLKPRYTSVRFHNSVGRSSRVRVPS